MKTILPPQAPKFPQRFKNHGDVRVDDYFWLRDRKHPETMKYLNAENAYFAAQMKPLEKMKNRLFKEMKARIKENDSTVPAPDGSYLYSKRFKKGLQYAQHIRRPKAGGRDHIYLDGNVLAKGKKYFSLSSVDFAPDENMLSYGVDFDGSEKYTLHFKDIKKNKILQQKLPNTSGGGVWAADSLHFFYVVLDKNLRPCQVFRHKLGTDPKKDKLVFEEKDSQHFVSIHKSSSEDYIFIYTGGKITSEMWFLRADRPEEKFQCIEKRKEGVEYQTDERGGEFWILTNYKAHNFQVMKTPVGKPARKNWKTFLHHSEKTLREGLSMFANFMVVTEQESGLPQIRVYDFKKKKDHVVKFSDPVYDAGLGANFEFHAQTLRLSYSSPITPDSVLDYNMTTRKFKTLKTKLVKGHRRANYVCERVWVSSHDRVKVPMTLVYKKGFKKNAKAAGYLYGYGSYGANMPDGFPARRDVFRLIDRGFVYALAHIRGGSEMGRSWYEDGKFLKKKNTFLDFIACAEYLIQNKWIAKDRLAICGGSAGGMLMGACMNMRPELFQVVAAHVPFVDVINTMFDKDLPLTQIEYKEWGNPADKKYYHYMKSYSPYDNVEKKAYPHLFVTCGLNDPRVTYWEPAKWVAKLRELKTDDHQLVFKTNMGAGHFGASGRFDHLWEQAEEYAFILNRFGIKK